MSVATLQANECREFVPERYHDDLEQWFETGTVLEVIICQNTQYGILQNVDRDGISLATHPGQTAVIEWSRNPHIHVMTTLAVAGQLNNAMLALREVGKRRILD